MTACTPKSCESELHTAPVLVAPSIATIVSPTLHMYAPHASLAVTPSSSSDQRTRDASSRSCAKVHRLSLRASEMDTTASCSKGVLVGPQWAISGDTTASYSRMTRRGC